MGAAVFFTYVLVAQPALIITPAAMHVVARKTLMVKNLAAGNAIRPPVGKSRFFNRWVSDRLEKQDVEITQT
jgi:hypothetical protein